MHIRPEIRQLVAAVKANEEKTAGWGSMFAKAVTEGSKKGLQKGLQKGKSVGFNAQQALKDKMFQMGTGVGGTAAAYLPAGARQVAGAIDKGISTVGRAGIAGGKYVARQPVGIVKDTAKAIPEAVGAAAGIVGSPKRHLNYYQQANPNMSAGRNFLRDTAGYGKEQMPGFGFGKFRYEPKSKAGQIGTELASLAWNPRMPSVRQAGGTSRRGFGQGQGIGRPLVAGTAGTIGYNVGNSTYQGMINAPLTGDRQIDSSIPKDVRQRINKEMLKAVPRLVWNAYGEKGNPVDKAIRDDFVKNFTSNLKNESLGYAQNLTNTRTTSGRNLALNQTIGRFAKLKPDFKRFSSQPNFSNLNRLRNSEAFDKEDLLNSSLVTTLKSMVLASDPAGKGYRGNQPVDQSRRRGVGLDVGGAVASRLGSEGDKKFRSAVQQLLKNYGLDNNQLEDLIAGASPRYDNGPIKR